VLAEKEAGAHVQYLKAFIGHDPSLAPSVVGKNNLFKLFICRAVELARAGGYISFIVPMPLLGDEQARGIRDALLRDGSFLQIHAFPQKDNRSRRVFRDAKLSTALFVFRKGTVPGQEPAPFPSVRHPGNTIDDDAPSLAIRTSEIPLYDPANATIVSCSQDDWDLAVRVAKQPGFPRLGSLCKSYQVEVNESNDHAYLSKSPRSDQTLVLRGSNVCMYALRGASQGDPLYLEPTAYQGAKARSEKAFHTRVERIGFQRSAPQNNYRRVIAAYIPAGEFCFDTVSYIPQGNTTLVDLDLLLALMNSKLVDWYFTIGSTNSKVNEYQFNILPCPVFRAVVTPSDAECARELTMASNDSPTETMSIAARIITETGFVANFCDASLRSMIGGIGFDGTAGDDRVQRQPF
jgi:hypothetical protein